MERQPLHDRGAGLSPAQRFHGKMAACYCMECKPIILPSVSTTSVLKPYCPIGCLQVLVSHTHSPSASPPPRGPCRKNGQSKGRSPTPESSAAGGDRRPGHALARHYAGDAPLDSGRTSASFPRTVDDPPFREPLGAGNGNLLVETPKDRFDVSAIPCLRPSDRGNPTAPARHGHIRPPFPAGMPNRERTRNQATTPPIPPRTSSAG